MKTFNLQHSTLNAQGGTDLPRAEHSVLNVECSMLPASPASPATRHPSRSQRGVALIVTLIMLSVITFLAVTFLAVSSRERGAVATAKDQTTAKLASDTATERAKAQIIAGMLATSNYYNFGALVSTNYINWDGFDPAPPAVSDFRTNVNFGYLRSGTALSTAQMQDNLAHLMFDPRPPVFIVNPVTGVEEFRYYRDENRNGRYDTNGNWPVFTDSNFDGREDPLPATPLTNNFVGDPEWIGVLERPELPHSGSNNFVARFAFNAVPIGNTLDLNYMFNQGLAPANSTKVSANYYLRNQGVGTYELNLAAFLYDLNTNSYAWGDIGPTPYRYDPFGVGNSGNGFADAAAMYRYRVAGNVSTLRSIHDLYGPPGDAAFIADQFDGYVDGPMLQQPGTFAGDSVPDQYTKAWPGAPNLYHFFTAQDLFDRAKTQPGVLGAGFSDRLETVANKASSYDRSTFQRLQSQVAMESAPEDAGKVHLNYINIGPFHATNFVSWDDPVVATVYGRPGVEVFFTNAVDKLLRRLTGEWVESDSKGFRAAFGVTKSFGVTDIPVFVNTNYVYAPSIHRILQLAANIADALTNRAIAPNGLPFPSVFRPVLKKVGNDVFITDFKEASDTAVDTHFSRPAKELSRAADLASFVPDDNWYGVPWIVGAKKGWPSFNEFAMKSSLGYTRKLQITRLDPNKPGKDGRIDVLYALRLTNVIAAEAWNSYSNTLNLGVNISVDHEMSMVLTNDDKMSPLELP
ncbi:MAG: hypothetical protein EPO07_19095, partial [Verrucomicrobia bacterium]